MRKPTPARSGAGSGSSARLHEATANTSGEVPTLLEGRHLHGRARAAIIAWVLTAGFYFYQYALRSSPGVMLPQLSEAFQLNSLGVASLVGVFYYGYASFSLLAGVALDQMGARAVVPTGALMVAAGALMFGASNLIMANIGRFLQGAGGVFAMVGAIYIISTNFPPSRAATLIGATQMFGMAGGSAGQFLVGPIIAGGVAWNSFWIAMGFGGLLVAVTLFVFLPKRQAEAKDRRRDWVKPAATALGVIFRNPQSLLCGLIAGLLFIPTTIFSMVWGVRFLQDAHAVGYGEAVMRSATVPMGWIIGCPLLGLLSDRLRRRKPVLAGGGCALLACLAWILYGIPGVFPPYVLGLMVGIASGAAMLPYTIIKEANPPQFSGTATGVINLLNFIFSAMAGPFFGWILQSVSGASTLHLEHYQTTFQPLLYGVGLAIVLTFMLKETGTAVRVPTAELEGV